MMKLELKHLAPYIPYDLKIQDGIGDIRSINTLDLSPRVIENGVTEYCSYIRPILRPMSDVKFIFQKLVDGMPFGPDYKSGLFFEEKKISKNTDLFIIKSTVCNELVLNKREPLTCPYLAIAILIENHFDVFGLIEKGLAIDINMIES